MIRIDRGETMENLTYEVAFELVKKELQKTLTKSPPIINEYLAHISNTQGKMIRAVSVLVCNEDKDGNINPEAVKAAVAVEIIHLASLVHDDVIDNADLRRGQETLQKKYGKRTAVICGDFLLSIALQKISKISDEKEYLSTSFPDYIQKLCLGELLQHINNWNLDLSMFDYFKIISGKTAALFEASFFAGALIGHNTDAEIRRYRRIGNYAGIIFQLQDDCLDFDKTMELAKKPVQSDYEQGVITLPLIHALFKLPDFKGKAQKNKISRDEVNQAVEEAEGLKFTRQIMDRYFRKAEREISKLDVSEEKRIRLTSILRTATGIKIVF